MTRPLEIDELLHHAGWLRGLARSLVHESAAAEDLVQDTWLAALRHPPARDPRAWLARVARNLASNARRATRRRATREALAHEERPTPPPPEVLEEAEAQRLLAEAITRLPEELRAVVVLRWFRALDSAAIGRELGLSPSAVRTRLQRALEALRRELDARFGGERRAWSVLLAPYTSAPTVGAAVTTVAAETLPLWLAAGGAALFLVALRFVPPDVDPEPDAAVRSALTPVVMPEAHREPLASVPTVSEPPAARALAAQVHAPRPEQEAPPEVELAGLIRLDGRPAEWPVVLELERPPSMAQADWDELMRARPRRVTTEATPGRFSFGPLPAGWRGVLRVEGATFPYGQSTLTLDRPLSDLVLDLRSWPMLTGTLLDPRGAPARSVTFVSTFQVHHDGRLIGEMSIRSLCDAEGRFRVPLVPRLDALPEGLTTRATLHVEQEDVGYLVHRTPTFDAEVGHDTGPLMLEPVRRLLLRVRTPHGAPIVGAIARLDPLQFRGQRAITDEHGETLVGNAPEAGAALRISAFGHADAVVPLPAAEPCEVVLRPLCVLEVQLVGPAEALARCEDLVLRAPRSPFVWESWGDEAAIQVELGASQLYSRSGLDPEEPATAWEGYYGENVSHRYALVGLQPGIPLQLEVLDQSRRALAVREWTAVSEEHTVLEIALVP